jgi:hypothetical protein
MRQVGEPPAADPAPSEALGHLSSLVAAISRQQGTQVGSELTPRITSEMLIQDLDGRLSLSYKHTLHLTDSRDISGFGSLSTSSTIRTPTTQLLESKDATFTKTTELLLSDNLAQLLTLTKASWWQRNEKYTSHHQQQSTAYVMRRHITKDKHDRQ